MEYLFHYLVDWRDNYEDIISDKIKGAPISEEEYREALYNYYILTKLIKLVKENE
jgi:hypothetical protein